ncbi:hypothetical protein B4U79_08794 [Dinothrombium tinctorium]|uniref:D-beta-hydroxybutyrate dehydrogenase-like protein n=1 Tax=Dinothrombium tinctorium TaxID=1965070 RepID=A0A3S3QCF4_9ACAR|nr:hypothetical protein B4U79_08794 [Dinothrombium tinctorium]
MNVDRLHEAWQLSCFICHFLINKLLSKLNPEKKIVIITGCDSGFGYLTAKLCIKYGFTVFATCLEPEGRGAQNLREEVLDRDKLVVIGADVTKDEDIDKVYEFLQSYIRKNYELWALVNNAGVIRLSPIEWGSFQYQFQDIFDVNVFGVIKMTRKFLPEIRKSRGRVINVSSEASRITFPILGSYCMSKHALAAFSDGLRREMVTFGVKVVSIEPKFYKTNLLSMFEQSLKKCWEDTNNEIKTDYRKRNMNHIYEKFCTKIIPLLTRKNPEEVAEIILHCLTASLVDPMYKCSSLTLNSSSNLLTLIPLEFSDILINFMLYLGTFYK